SSTKSTFDSSLKFVQPQVLRVHLNFVRAKHFGRQFISNNQRFTAEMLRPYEYICKNGMLQV
ncbi:MAG: hypothetical protein EAZ10_10975, partial [Oscillatoriales cyanobacterium]